MFEKEGYVFEKEGYVFEKEGYVFEREGVYICVWERGVCVSQTHAHTLYLAHTILTLITSHNIILTLHLDSIKL